MSTLKSGHHQAMVKEYGCIHKLSTDSWGFPPFHKKYIKNICKENMGKINYKKA